MTKTFYIQTDHENRITDIISFAHEDYKPVELNTPLPPNILGGCYELVNDSPIYRKEWDKSEDKQKIAELEATVLGLMDVIAGGANNA